MKRTASMGVLTGCLLGGLAASQAPKAAPALDAATRKAVESMATEFFKARPATRFEEWDSQKRTELLKRADAVAIPEGASKELRPLLWKIARAHGPLLDGTKPLESRWGKGAYDVVNPPSKAAGSQFGCLIGLHGGGEGAGDKGEAKGNWSSPLAKHKLLGIYPQAIRLVHDAWNTAEGERFVLTLMDMAKRTYDLDPDRIFVAGFSMGGTGSWYFAGRYPQFFAGAMPFHGVIFAADKYKVADEKEFQHGLVPNVRHVPLYYTTGSVDANCPPASYVFAGKLLEKWKAKHADGYDVNFRCVEGLAHAFPPGEPGKAFEWLLPRKRKTFPKSLTWEAQVEHVWPPGADWPLVKDFYWLRCAEPTEKMSVEASIDGQNIQIDVQRHAPAGFRVYLSPELVDVAKPVTILANGEKKYEGTPTPSLAAMLESLDVWYDRNRILDRKVDF